MCYCSHTSWFVMYAAKIGMSFLDQVFWIDTPSFIMIFLWFLAVECSSIRHLTIASFLLTGSVSNFNHLRWLRFWAGWSAEFSLEIYIFWLLHTLYSSWNAYLTLSSGTSFLFFFYLCEFYFCLSLLLLLSCCFHLYSWYMIFICNMASRSSVNFDCSASSGKKRRGGPGGLNKLCGVSPELQTIVGQATMPRTEVCSFVHNSLSLFSRTHGYICIYFIVWEWICLSSSSLWILSSKSFPLPRLWSSSGHT